MIPFTLIAVGIILIALNLNAVLKEKSLLKDSWIPEKIRWKITG